MRKTRRGYRPVVAVLGLVAWSSTGCGSQNPEELSYRARAAFDSGRAAEAEAHLARLARIRWLTAPERLLLSQIAGDRGRVEEALATFPCDHSRSWQKNLEGGKQEGIPPCCTLTAYQRLSSSGRIITPMLVEARQRQSRKRRTPRTPHPRATQYA